MLAGALGVLGVPGALGTVGCDGERPSLAATAPPSSALAPSVEPAGAVSQPSGATGASAAVDEGPPLIAPAVPVVDLAGVATVPPPPEGPRVAALGWVTPIYARPSKLARRMGHLRAGAVVVAAPESEPARDCQGGWRGIEPAGFVCLGEEATTDLAHPIVRATARRADPTGRLPYMYGVVTRGGPVYARLPTAADLARHEPNLASHLAKWKADEESGARYGLDVWLRWTPGTGAPDPIRALEERTTDPTLPWFLEGGAQAPNLSGLVKSAADVKVAEIARRQGRSFLESFLFEGRRYNVTPDLLVVPADRFRPIRGSAFHGWQVDKELAFPFALVRRPGARKWLWNGSAMVDGGALEWRSAVPLTDRKRFHGGVLHFEAKEGFWVDDRHVGRVDPARRWPKWAQQGEKWIDISLTEQILVAYEGTKMVYATLVSSGEDGLAEAATSKATIRGIFRIHTKWVATTMDSQVVGEEFELRDVPWVQYFHEGYALHGAYWHDRFGQPKSHGCVNLAPEDARRLFYWTDPPVPFGWHGAQKSLTGAVVFIHP
jgi:hypothetical protein